MYTLKPLGSFIVVRVEDEAEKTSPGGIIIPDKAKERPAQGEVVSVGPGAYGLLSGERVTPQVKVGERIMFLKHALIELNFDDGSKLHAITESDVIGIIQELPNEETLVFDMLEAA